MMHTEGLLFSIQKSRLNSGVIKILVKKRFSYYLKSTYDIIFKKATLLS